MHTLWHYKYVFRFWMFDGSFQICLSDTILQIKYKLVDLTNQNTILAGKIRTWLKHHWFWHNIGIDFVLLCYWVLRLLDWVVPCFVRRDLFKLLIHIIFLFSDPLQCDEGLSTSWNARIHTYIRTRRSEIARKNTIFSYITLVLCPY